MVLSPSSLSFLGRRVENRVKSAVRGRILTLVLLQLACVGAKDRPRARAGLARSYSENRTGLVSGRAGEITTTDIYHMPLGQAVR